MSFSITFFHDKISNMEQLILHAIQLLLAFGIIALLFLIILHVRKYRINPFKRFATGFWIGLITDMLDTMGIGSFATTTTFYKLTHLIEDDSKIPGTMNAIHAIPVMVQAFCFITVVRVEPSTLIPMALASFFGALAGPHLTKGWNTKTVQRVLGILLLIAAAFSIYRMIADPGSHNSSAVHGLNGFWLIFGVVYNFIIGILMTLGLGNYAPELIFFSLMGLSPAIAMPVMMLDGAMIMTASATQFIKEKRVEWTGSAGMIIGGVLGVLIAVRFLTSLDLNLLKQFVIIVVIFTGVMMIRSSLMRSPLKSHAHSNVITRKDKS